MLGELRAEGKSDARMEGRLETGRLSNEERLSALEKELVEIKEKLTGLSSMRTEMRDELADAQEATHAWFAEADA
jgi:hypothetical protein